MKLSFVVCGVQKSGTTALHRFLSQHDKIFLPKKKELHFFDNEKIDWRRPDYDRRYHKYFSNAESHQLCGEITPIYSYWGAAMGRIRDYNPDAKIIIILRDPVARAYSHWRMQVKRGRESLPFSTAIRSGRQRVLRGRELAGYERNYSYVERGFYYEQLARIFADFPPDRVLVLRNSDLKSLHKETLDRVCDFLSVSRFQDYPEAENVFTHSDVQPIRVQDAGYLSELYKADLAAVRDKYGIVLETEGIRAAQVEYDMLKMPALVRRGLYLTVGRFKRLF